MPHKINIINNKFFSNMSFISIKNSIGKYIMLSILILFSLGCSKEEKKCKNEKIYACIDVVEDKNKKKNSVLPSGGAIQLNDSTLFITFFDYSTNTVSEKYVVLGCDCELLYYEDERPK
jgi:hypothetical protein